MSRLLLRMASAGLVLAALLLACGGRGPHGSEARAATPTTSPPPSAPGPTLDDGGPTMDLLASRALWHLYRDGLLIPFASEGFRKYSQEYSNPWRGAVTLDDREGRTLSGTAALLRFPWEVETGPATITVRVHGASAGKKLSVRLNG